MIISSTTTDKNSDGNWCAWATIKKGRVVSVSDETGREGGELWNDKGFTANGNLDTVLQNLARNWPNFYKLVRQKACNNKLLPLKRVQNNHLLYDINSLLGEVEELEAQIREKNRKLRQLRKKINKL